VLRFSQINRNATTAVLLGALGLFLNLLEDSLTKVPLLHPGDLFLFLSAGALGVPGAFLSSIFVIPEAIIADSVLPLRVIPLCFAVGYCGIKLPKTPAYAIGVVAWTLVFWPTFSVLNDFVPLFGPAARDASQSLALVALSEILLLLVSGAILLNKDVWGLITKRPRSVNVEDLLVHLLPLISTTVIFVTLLASQSTVSDFSAENFLGKTKGLLFLITLCVLGPVLVGLRLSRVITRNFQELTRTGVLGSSASFSGLSAEFWRRQHTFEESRPRIGSTMAGLVTDGNLNIETKKRLNSPDQGICALNRNGTVTFANRKFKSFAEIKINNVIGKKIEALGMNPVMRDHLLKVLETTFSKGPSVTELRLNDLPDSLRFFEIASLRSDAFENSSLSSGPDSIIVTVKDITDRRTVESRLLQAQRVDSLGELVNGVSQSFNNALTAIAAEASFALALPDQKAALESLSRILNLTKSAGSLVQQLLKYADGQPGQREILRMSDFLSERLSLLQRALGGTCEVCLSDPGIILPVKCDPTLLTQALTSLLLNAKESYHEGTGKIEICLDEEEIGEDISLLHGGAQAGRYARLRVKDYGSGMNAETLAKAFDPLFTTKGRGHTGLGLSIVHAVVRAHDGFLTAESYPKKGTTISLYFPISSTDVKFESPTIPVSEGTQVAEIPKGKKESILVIEEDIVVNDLLVQLLSCLGYDVTGCAAGANAFEECRKKDFDLVLVDVLMPRMSPSEVVIQVQENAPKSRVVVMSGSGSLPADTHGVKKVIAKPFEVFSLADAVRSALDSPLN
jgi:signal transduction histidine kinase